MAFRHCATELADPESKKTAKARPGSVTCGRDPIYLFACHLEWRDRENLRAYKELVSALDDPDENIRLLAETLLHRSSPHPKGKVTGGDWCG